MKIVIEGMDGAGKSTVAKIVAKSLNATYADGMLFNFLHEQGMSVQETDIVKKAIEACADNENSIIRTWAYGFANIFNMLHYTTDVVIDRHCLTTFFYNGDDESKEMFKYMQRLVGKPDIVFILHASEETRRRRICQRDINDPDLYNGKKMQYGYDQLESAAQYLDLNYKVIYTEGKDAATVATEIILAIERSNSNGIVLADHE